MSLKEKVKTMKITDNFRKKKSNVWGEFEKTSDRVYQFNIDGNLVEFNRFKEDGTPAMKTVYTYNDKQNKVEATNFDANNNQTSTTITTVNGNGFKTEEQSYSSDGKLSSRHTFEYDDKNNNTKKTIYRADGTVSGTFTWTYDSKGNPIKVKKQFSGSTEHVQDFVYNEKGYLLGETSYDDRGGIDIRFERYYDEYGNKIQEIKYKRRDLLGSQAWKYEYDKQGNWVKKIHINGEGIEFHTEERKIIYY
jgi:hypothetical protein